MSNLLYQQPHFHVGNLLSSIGYSILLATDGIGYYQEKGQPKKILRKGDVIKCPPNIKHWHGVSIDSYFVQVAITNTQNGAPVWLEAVTNIEYTQVQTNK
ncbi:hypothetical protein [Flavobacterium yafengii]|uniref:Cupin domain-containing protein n=1 Tax=Flavobacterium yafengii TaxID=3041253 RepID=A0AAW6TPE0_9FLAO|nr:hypothetical protein [Flavobacterium yafengii]MDI5949983.1 hypothetical protein [Flavobacterium yafengii]